MIFLNVKRQVDALNKFFHGYLLYDEMCLMFVIGVVHTALLRYWIMKTVSSIGSTDIPLQYVDSIPFTGSLNSIFIMVQI